LLEKSDLLAILAGAGIASPSVGDLFETRPSGFALASPTAVWQADDAAALFGRTEALAATLASKLVSEEPACAQATSATTLTSGCVDKAVAVISRSLFRRPPTDEMAARYAASIQAEVALTKSAIQGLAFGFELAMQSPAFLYRSEIGQPSVGQPNVRTLDVWEIADALAFGIAGRPMDSELEQAASSGALMNADVVRSQAVRLARTPAGQERVWQFYERWLYLTNPVALVKDSTAFPSFSVQTARAAHAETKQWVLDSVFGSAAGGLRQLLAGERQGRVGVHTQSAFLMSQAGPVETRPLHIADVLLKTVACVKIPPPPAGAVMTPFTPDPSRSVRQNFETRTSTGSCGGCHSVMNGTGFAFDAYDAAGQPRSTLKGFPIDTSGTLTLPSGLRIDFGGPADLLSALADASDTRSCHAEWMFRYVRGIDQQAETQCERDRVAAALGGAASSPIEGFVELYAAPSFLHRKEVTP
jgi:hypothetical protein